MLVILIKGAHMCGIFGYVGSKKTAADIVLAGLKSLEYRGYDSWGVAEVTDGKGVSPVIKIKKRAGKIGNATVESLPPSSFAFGHTRWATHGGVTDVNAHPHLDCTKKFAVIHNGIIENYVALKNELKKRGHTFVSDTDSEVVAHMVEEEYPKHGLTKAVQLTFNKLEGLNAIIVISVFEKTLIAARNGSPLVVGFSAKANYLASDAAALLPYTKQVHFLEDDEMAIVETDKVQIYNARTGDRIRPHKQRLNWTVDQAEKGKYGHFMLKEIYEQPGIFSDIASTSVDHAKHIDDLIKSKDISLIGCGSAYHACVAGQYLFSKIAKAKVSAIIGSEFRYQADFITPKSAVIALSQSGETMDTLEAVKFAKKRKSRTIALVNVLGSTLYRIADEKILISAGPEKGVASSKAYTGKLAHLLLLAYGYAGKISEGRKSLMDATVECKRLLRKDAVSQIHGVAERMKSAEHVYCIGRGVSYPTALETALKIKEISYIHAEGFAAGELKHGVIALIEKGTPCIAFMPQDETFGDTLSGAMEMKARGGYIIGVSPVRHEVFDEWIEVRNIGDATILPNTLVGQLLAYDLTLMRGHDPDMPRNLAKSVTVK